MTANNSHYVIPSQRDEYWTEQAHCAQVDPELFFPESRDRSAANRAKAVCRACPVRRQCLEFALKHHISDGIWGGLTGAERYPLEPPRVPRPSGFPAKYQELRDLGVHRLSHVAERLGITDRSVKEQCWRHRLEVPLP